MSFLEQLSRGNLGVRFSLPETFVLEHDDESLRAVSKKKDAALWMFRSDYRLDLNPAHLPILKQDLERAARDLFIQTSKQLPRQPIDGLRTDDASWSPLIEVTPIELPGGSALAVLHRMSYQPGNETIMGHILIPVQDGMIEVRFLTVAKMTGLRESIVVDLKLKESPLQDDVDPIEQLKGRFSQKDFDDPALDEKFPEHPLSLARALLRQLQAPGTLTITAPPNPPPSELVSNEAGCAFVPPPRYLLHEESVQRLQLAKMSIATTDGTALLTVVRIGELKPSLASGLEDLIQKIAPTMPPEGSGDIDISVCQVTGPDQRIDFEGQLYFTREDGYLGQTAIRAFEDKNKEVWLLTIGAGRSSPSVELFQELEGVVKTFRRIGKPPTPWYKFW